MGRKQIVVLEALSKAKKPMSLQDLADKKLTGDGRDEVYGASDLRSTFRRLGARGLLVVAEDKRTTGKGDEAKEVSVQAATITDAGRAALKEAQKPQPTAEEKAAAAEAKKAERTQAAEAKKAEKEAAKAAKAAEAAKAKEAKEAEAAAAAPAPDPAPAAPAEDSVV